MSRTARLVVGKCGDGAPRSPDEAPRRSPEGRARGPRRAPPSRRGEAALAARGRPGVRRRRQE